jgi:hypothetical protein
MKVEFSTAEFRERIGQLKSRSPQAIVKSLNRAIISARVVMVRDIARDMALKQATVRERIFVEQARPERLEARLSASRKRIPLIEFGARGPMPSRGRGRGVTYRLGRGRGRAESAFLARMKSGHLGVFRRVGTKRLPIRELRGPSLGRVFEQKLPAGLARGQEQLLKNLKSELAFAMRSAAAA